MQCSWSRMHILKTNIITPELKYGHWLRITGRFKIPWSQIINAIMVASLIEIRTNVSFYTCGVWENNIYTIYVAAITDIWVIEFTLEWVQENAFVSYALLLNDAKNVS
jgi:hypothetical protein